MTYPLLYPIVSKTFAILYFPMLLLSILCTLLLFRYSFGSLFLCVVLAIVAQRSTVARAAKYGDALVFYYYYF